MNQSQFFSPVRILFGKEISAEVGKEGLAFGNRCLLVSQESNDEMKKLKDKVKSYLEMEKITVVEFTKIRSNPLYTDLEEGIEMIQKMNFDFVVAVGGGSVIDSGKILSCAYRYEIKWEELFKCKEIKNINHLPLIAIPTTAGTGSHCTQAAVISDEKNHKHTIFSHDLFPTLALVDHDLLKTLPASLLASTGFDAFCHLSESYISGRQPNFIAQLAMDAMQKLNAALPLLLENNREKERTMMSEVDTCAGIALSNGGASLPHKIAETISGVAYRINHGCSLAIAYPPFLEAYYEEEIYHDRIEKVLKIINNHSLPCRNGKEARKIMEQFLHDLKLPYHLSDYQFNHSEYAELNKLLVQLPISLKKSLLEDFKEQDVEMHK